MNKRDLTKAVAVHSDVDLATASKVLDGFTDVVTSVVSKGESVLITGFAKFAKVERAARMGRNPATGEQIHIKASKRARITPAKTFKEAVLSRTGGPKLARGAWPVDAAAVKRAGRSGAATTPVKKVPRKAPAKKAVATKKAPAKRAAAVKKTRATKKVAGARKAAVKKVTTKRPAAKKVAGRGRGHSFS
jgi:DNA-binding protein HU-beta